MVTGGLGWHFLIGAGAGALIGLGFAIKVTTVLVGGGIAVGLLLSCGASVRRPHAPAGTLAALAGMAGGFCGVAVVALVPWGTRMFGPAVRAGSYTSIGSPWRAVRSGLHLIVGQNAAEDLVKAGALLLGAVFVILLINYMRRTSAQPLAAVAFALVFAWLLAWPYVLPWYDGLGWALLAMLPASRFDWLMLARTAALAIGYLPARGIRLPAGLGWLETVVRTAVTPAVLLAVVVLALVWLWPARPKRLGAS